MTLPVDVVVPLTASRKWFFDKFVLPSLETQNPSRIIIEDGPGGACEKRNAGVAKATSKYVFLVDDDIVVSGGYLERAIMTLESCACSVDMRHVAYTYSDWIQVPLEGCMDPPITNAQYVVIPEFEHLPLHDHGGVDWPVVNRELFVPFDEKVKRYQTWDWSLVMKRVGLHGIKINDYNMISFMLDRGITTGTGIEESAKARQYIQRKHGFIP